MNSPTKLRSEVDDAIRANPDLFNAIQIATEQLTPFTEKIGASPTLTWRLPASDEPVIELTMTETTDTGPGKAQRQYPLRYMKDPGNRDISVLQVWSDLLTQRRKRRNSRLNQLIDALELEEQNGAPVGS